jgi:protoheme IX farnesyltransferase
MSTDLLTTVSPDSRSQKLGFRRTVLAYVSLTKPRVMELLLVVTVPAMILAERGLPNLWLVLATLLGGAMSAGSAGAFNCYLDRDMDREPATRHW